jgi:hypothetical protein
MIGVDSDCWLKNGSKISIIDSLYVEERFHSQESRRFIFRQDIHLEKFVLEIYGFPGLTFESEYLHEHVLKFDRTGGLSAVVVIDYNNWIKI